MLDGKKKRHSNSRETLLFLCVEKRPTLSSVRAPGGGGAGWVGRRRFLSKATCGFPGLVDTHTHLR